MTPAGYSGTPLLKKLGLKPGLKIRLVRPPDDYFKLLEMDISEQFASPGEVPDWVHLFARSSREFAKEMGSLKKAYKRNTELIIWVSWYKKSAGIPTDLTENMIRDWALANGLVDIKVCAVSEEWSGLKLVVPVGLRGK